MSRKDKHSKGYAQTIHAIARAQQRYGLTLTRSDIMDLVRQIRDYRNGVEFVEKQSNRVSIFRVVIRGQKYPVAYDKSRGTICTFLPPEYEPGKWLAGFGRVDIQTMDRELYTAKGGISYLVNPNDPSEKPMELSADGLKAHLMETMLNGSSESERWNPFALALELGIVESVVHEKASRN